MTERANWQWRMALVSDSQAPDFSITYLWLGKPATVHRILKNFRLFIERNADDCQPLILVFRIKLFQQKLEIQSTADNFKYFLDWREGRGRKREYAGTTPAEATEAQRRKRNELLLEFKDSCAFVIKGA
jgi:hypothetical protein